MIARLLVNAPLRSGELTDAGFEAAIRADDVVGAVAAGVDPYQARDGHVYVIEVNSVPGVDGGCVR